MASLDDCRPTVLVFVAALAMRVFGVAVTTVTNLNTYAQADANGFSRAAAYIADGLQNGAYTPPPSLSNTYDTWGTFLAPFWLLPGPSRVYARLGMALLGALAVYNTYIIARKYGSQQAAVVAVVPLIFYPSVIFVQTTVLREVAVLLGLTAGARFLAVPSRRLPILANYGIAGIFLWLSVVLRPDNLPVIGALLILAVVLNYHQVFIRWWMPYVALLPAMIGTVLAYPRITEIIRSLAETRRNRAEGRTVYLEHTFAETVVSATAFSWIGAVYFLFTPFPWMVEQISDMIVFIEALGNLVFAAFGIWGARTISKRNLTVGVVLSVGVVLAAVLYGLGTANVGTAVRHRQMLTWVIFILGGVGITEKMRFILGTEDETEQRVQSPSNTQ